MKIKMYLELNTDRDLEILKTANLLFRAVIGCYKGKISPSYEIEAVFAEDIGICKALAAKYKQESILFVFDNSFAELYMTDTKEFIYLGNWKEVTVITNLEGWTYDPETRKTYTVK